MIDGSDAGPLDFFYLKQAAEERGYNVEVVDVSEEYTTIGLWGPNARENLQKVVDDPESLSHENFPFAALRDITIAGKTVTAFRLSYVGEQGWELHMKYEDGLAVWDALRDQDIMAFGVETYANSRRMEKSLRLQNADLLTEYNLIESDLQRPKVKQADFRGKEANIRHREMERQHAYLCTLVMTDNVDEDGVARYPVGTCPILDPATGKTLVDALGRRSFTTSMAYGPTIGKNIMLAYIPSELAQEGREFEVDYMGRNYPVRLEGVGYKPLYDPENLKPRS